MFNYQLTQEQLNNLIIFLNRVETKGYTEALELIKLVQLFQNPIEEKME